MVSEIMTTDVTTVSPNTAIDIAATTMADLGVGALPVVDDDGILIGLLEDEHIIVEDARLPEPTYVQLFGAYIRLPGTMRRFEEEFAKLSAADVASAMDDDPATIPADATVEDVATLMIDRKMNRILVVDESGRLAGIVARIDVVRLISRAGS